MPASDASEDDADYRVAWRRDDDELRADAIAFWSRLGRLPRPADPNVRASELCVLAYVGGELAAVSTVVIRSLPFLSNARFGMFRSLVAPAFRRHGASRAMVGMARDVLSDWSMANPGERLAGLGAVMQSREFAAAEPDAAVRRPVLRRSRLTAAAYEGNGDVVRICWFDHARV